MSKLKSTRFARIDPLREASARRAARRAAQNSKLQKTIIRKLIDYFFFSFPIIKFKVKEKSMEPAIKEGQIVFISKYHYFFKRPKVGEIVVIRSHLYKGATFTKENKQFIIKRIQKIDKDKVFVVGDNKIESVDSRMLGWISIDYIVGKVIN